MRRPRSITLSTARTTAEPPTLSAPEPPLPRPVPRLSVSPANTWIRSGDTPRPALTSCVKAVSLPWPIEVDPANRATEPSGLIRSSAVSGFIAVYGPPATSMGLAIPSPRSAPRSRASARRFSNPARSARASAMSMPRANSPQSYVKTSPVLKGIADGGMTFLRRSSTGSTPSSRAARSITRSMAYVASGLPAPRYGPVGVVFEKTPVVSTQMAGVVYTPASPPTLLVPGPALRGVRYAPTLSPMATRRPRNRPPASSASSAVETLSRPCSSVTKASRRSDVHPTGRPSRFAAHSTSAISGYMPLRMPKLPPTSPVTTRTWLCGTCRMSARMARLPCGPWMPVCSV